MHTEHAPAPHTFVRALRKGTSLICTPCSYATPGESGETRTCTGEPVELAGVFVEGRDAMVDRRATLERVCALVDANPETHTLLSPFDRPWIYRLDLRLGYPAWISA